MPSIDQQSLSWLRTHHATISTGALQDSGVSLDQRKRLVEAGMLRRVVDGAYAFTGRDVDELARCAARLCTAGRNWSSPGRPPADCGRSGDHHAMD